MKTFFLTRKFDLCELLTILLSCQLCQRHNYLWATSPLLKQVPKLIICNAIKIRIASKLHGYTEYMVVREFCLSGIDD